ncbi:hypothetical protein QFZ24_009026 [Streptomyces phaeochromogenes]|nr:hypothetical protein [Streptomyces phaeochromogenes]
MTALPTLVFRTPFFRASLFWTLLFRFHGFCGLC